jgi:PST family polysaccharide transporter
MKNIQTGSSYKKLIHSIVLLGSSQALTTLVAIVRNKALAILLGPSGVGLISQLMTVQNFTASVVPMGMQLGALKYLSQIRIHSPVLLPRYISTTSRVFLWLSVITTMACLLFIKPLSSLALGNSEFYLYLVPPLLGVPFLVQSQLWLTYLQSGLEIKTYAKVGIVTSVIGLFVVVPLVLQWGQWGASFHLLIFAIIGFVIARVYAYQSIDAQIKATVRTAPFDMQVLRNLLKFGGANLSVLALDMGIPFIIRAQIIHDLGLSANGIYQAVYAISTQILMMPMSALGIYALPRISQLIDKSEINAEVNTFVKFAFAICTPLILIILLMRDVVINLLFSAKFLPAIAILPWQLAGDLFRSVTMAIQFPTITQERFKARIVINLLQNVIFIIVFYCFPAPTRLHGAVCAYASGWLFALIAMYIYTNRLNGYSFTRGNWRLLIVSSAAVLLTVFLPFTDLKLRMLGFGIVLLWLVVGIGFKNWIKAIYEINRFLQTKDVA